MLVVGNLSVTHLGIGTGKPVDADKCATGLQLSANQLEALLN
jgi:hypothetical protein